MRQRRHSSSVVVVDSHTVLSSPRTNKSLDLPEAEKGTLGCPAVVEMCLSPDETTAVKAGADWTSLLLEEARTVRAGAAGTSS